MKEEKTKLKEAENSKVSVKIMDGSPPKPTLEEEKNHPEKTPETIVQKNSTKRLEDQENNQNISNQFITKQKQPL